MSASQDRLAACLESFRADTESQGDGGASRVAIVQRLAKRHRRRRGLFLLGLILGASLLVPVAQAGWRRWQTYRASQPAIAKTDEAKKPAATKVKRGNSTPKTPATIIEGTAPVPAAPSVAETSAAAAPTLIEAPAVPSTPARKGGATYSETALYGRAHEMHFRGGDWDKALAAWSAYLVKFPNGQLAPEARFNRAICLVRLKRLEDAKVALAELAANAPALHQREQARRLLDGLGDR